MPIAHRGSAWRSARPWLSAMAAVTLMLAALVGPVLAQEHTSRSSEGDGSTSLRDPRLSVRLARPTTTIRFAVTYRDGNELAAGVRPDRDRWRLAAHAGDLPVDPVRPRCPIGYTAKLPAGRHRIGFEARSVDGGTAAARGGWIRIVAGRAPSGSTAGSGGPTGGSSTGGSSTDDGSTQGPSGGSTAGRSDPGPAGPTAERPVRDDADADHGLVEGTGGSGAGRIPDGAVDGETGFGLPVAPETTPAAIARVDGGTGPQIGPAGSGSGPRPGGGTAGGGPGNAAVDPLAILGVSDGLFDRVFRATPVMITTSGTVVVWAAFLFLGKRRRDGEPTAPDPVLAAHAASGPDRLAVAALVPPLAPIELPPGVDPTEAGLPRWRRPSLLQARKTDPLRSAVGAASLTFDRRRRRRLDGLERRRIRYRLVRLLDLPDELRASRSASSTRATRSSSSRRTGPTGWSSARTGSRAGSTR